MIKINARFCIRSMVDLVLTDWDPNKGLYLSFGSECQKHRNKIRYANTQVLINASSNYKTIWTYTTYGSKFHHNTEVNWGPDGCHHDSCWIGAVEDALNKMYFTLSDQVCDKTAPIKLDYFNTIQAASVVKMEKVRVPDRGRSRYYVKSMQGFQYEVPADHKEVHPLRQSSYVSG